ncbi:signaling lymphocytic activation molecule-like isoform X2 [Falco biarmicus]|uniref:signaling lymphocytic activation molecule isoform X1 n=1 Tax=Falco peregrinus TaxID=8954 RepID=UPI00247957F5|nr:signaling lymphocytic activation molecule isoform X1 [Falco peregrinus]XP_056177934.1 signaling lymphocytic activation molecule-like isoform X2 [Falco biarmicus]
MGCSVCLWLLISLGRVWGMGHGAREMVLGTLGKATTLQIPPDLQDLTLRFGEAVWKRDTEDPQRKLVLLKYLDGNYTNYMQGRALFHRLNFSLEILNTSRQDGQLYEYIVSKGPEEKVWQIQLEVYEPVSDPSIQILSQVPANGSCTITLNCTAARGDSISYSWGSQDSSISQLCSHNGSLLHLSYPLQNTSIPCTCTASNPISTRVIVFNSSKCSYEQGGSAGLRREHLVLLVVLPIAAVIVLIGAFVATHLAMPMAGREQEQSPLAENNAVHTIYSQVQRVQKQKCPAAAEHPSCTTIYAAATGLPPDMALAPGTAPHAPRSPLTQPPAPQGHAPLSQSPDKEPMTVYASVMMPMA